MCAFLIGCGSSSNNSAEQNNPSSNYATSALLPNNINLIFVTSPDLLYSNLGDIQANSNLTSQGLNRSLQLATYLKQNILGGQNVTQIFSLQPTSHMQNGHPDMTALEFIQQFAMLNQYTQTLPATYGGTITGNSMPLNVSYTQGAVPSIVPSTLNQSYCTNCQGLNFNTNNSQIISNIVNNQIAGYYVFSAPWETIQSLMTTLNSMYDLKLNLPNTFQSSNLVYTVSFSPTKIGSAKLNTYNSAINPSTSYPQLQSQISTNNPCQATPFSLNASDSVYSGINKNMTIYFVRHAEAHPNNTAWDDGNYIAAGQWRALSLPAALQNKISPSMVFSIDPSQIISESGTNSNFSYVRPSLTVQPYAIANNLPYYVAYSVLWYNPAGAIDYFFYNSQFANKTILVGWEHGNIQDIVQSFLSTKYFKNVPSVQDVNSTAVWAYGDYDSIWTVNIDSNGNLNVNNSLCEGINTLALPSTPPIF